MNFTDIQYEKLYKTYCNGSLVIVEGCNCFGQEFTVVGKISSVVGEEIPELNPDPEEIYAGVFDNSIVLEFSDEKQSEDDIRSKFNAIFFTTLEGEAAKLNNFLIKNIKLEKTGKVLFENNTQEYQTHLKNGVIKFCNYNLNKKLIGAATANVYDERFFWLYNMVGKPIDINGLTGLLFSVDSVSKNGDIMLHYLDFTQFKTGVISKDSKIYLDSNVIRIDAPEQITVVTNREPNVE